MCLFCSIQKLRQYKLIHPVNDGCKTYIFENRYKLYRTIHATCRYFNSKFRVEPEVGMRKYKFRYFHFLTYKKLTKQNGYLGRYLILCSRNRNLFAFGFFPRNAKRHRNLTVVLSEHNRATTQETQVETRRVIQVFTYPKYNPQGPKNHDHDIALLKLETPLEVKSAISPVCLPQIGKILVFKLKSINS